jgi:hypothetical protein
MIKILKKIIIYFECRKLNIGWKEYSVNKKGEVDIKKSVIINNCKEIPINFGTIYGDFKCYNSNLDKLEYLPKEVINTCILCYNNLKSFNNLPKCKSIIVDGNDIKSFEGFNMNIKSFKGNPVYRIFKKFNDVEKIDLLNDFDAIRDNEIILDRFQEFLLFLGKPKIDKHQYRLFKQYKIIK